jgi:hypothetical protein
MTGLSVVAPVYNEAAILPELARRCAAAAIAAAPDAEVLLVDDASTDATRKVAAALVPPVRVLHLPANRGQLGATFAGLREARGDVIVVIDGDLQDPPEHIPALVATLRSRPDLDVVFAAKTRRDDPAWFLVGRAAYGALLSLPGARAVPPGCGAYCAMRPALAARVAALAVPDGNLAPLLIALGARSAVVGYEKVARYDGRSRVGAWGLVREAIPSLALTGALSALAGWSSVALTLVAALTSGPASLGLVVAAAALAVAGLAVATWARRVLTTTTPRGPA